MAISLGPFKAYETVSGCSGTTAGLLHSLSTGFGTVSGRQFASIFQSVPEATRDAIDADVNGIVCWPRPDVEFDLAGWNVTPSGFDSFVHSGATIATSTFYFLFDQNPLSGTRPYTITGFVGQGFTGPNPSTYWSDLGLISTDDGFYNN